MIDLSNNNAVSHDFHTIYVKAGQRRLYLKRCQGTHYTDPTYSGLRSRALAAGLHVGAYDFLEPLASTPAQAAAYFLKLLPKPLKPGRDLRPALDCEHGTPSPKVGVWVMDVAHLVWKGCGVKPLIYGSGYWLEACRFPSAPGPLWLAAYGRDDGKEYPVGKLPAPWKVLAAHQFTDKAKVVGVHGLCDLSHVYVPGSVEVPKTL